MASAARAYAHAPAAAPQRGVDLRVVRGKGSASSLPSHIIFAAKVFMMALAVFAVVACVRIGLASATVTTNLEAEQLNAQVNDVRSGSAHLEVTESSLTNPTSVKSLASGKLGMSAPQEFDTVVLEPDVVAYDEAGNLSLARSLSMDIQNQGRVVQVQSAQDQDIQGEVVQSQSIQG